MTLGSGIAVAAIWTAVAYVGSKNVIAAVTLSIMAALATACIAEK